MHHDASLTLVIYKGVPILLSNRNHYSVIILRDMRRRIAKRITAVMKPAMASMR